MLSQCIENFLPTITLVYLLQHLAATHLRAMLLGQENTLSKYHDRDEPPYQFAEIFGWVLSLFAFALVLCSPALAVCFSPRCIPYEPEPVSAFSSFVLVLSCPALAICRVVFSTVSRCIPGFEPELPAIECGEWTLTPRGQIPLLPPPDLAYLRSFARYTLVPSSSPARLLREKGWANLRVMGRGVDGAVFSVRLHFLRHPSFLRPPSSLARVLPPSTLHDAGVDFDEGRECSFALHFTLLIIGYQSRVPSSCSTTLLRSPSCSNIRRPSYIISLTLTPFTCTYIIFLTSFPPLSPPFSILSLLNRPIFLALNNTFSSPFFPPRSPPCSILHPRPSTFLFPLLSTHRSPADVVVLWVGRLSPEKDLSFVVWGVAQLDV
ncbi:hypothetical protein B0H13DRAFT_2318313 [Mycena leptocephala]|nr:hypothetical protein B0H13DRAFT_2318313 [Mycena leptocephala]